MSFIFINYTSAIGSSGSVKNFIIPSTIIDPAVSPGCYLPVNTTPYFFS